MSGDRCTGHCCRSFPLIGFGETPEEIATFIRECGIDGVYIADMAIPLRKIEKGTLLSNGTIADGPREGGGWIFTCQHFDAEAGNCTAYATRPAMCRDYPYGRVCEIPDCTWTAARAGEHPPQKPRRHLPMFKPAERDTSPGPVAGGTS